MQREIELLREYRTRLVTDVVTGKLNVRETAARLPDDVSSVSIEPDEEMLDSADDLDEEEDAEFIYD